MKNCSFFKLAFYYFLLQCSCLLSAQDLYQLDKVQELKIYFPFSNWDFKLDSIHQKDTDLRLLSSYILLNGTRLDSVGIKYKGNSTYNATRAKNPLNIKLDFIIEDQNFQGYKTLKLSNGFMDPSFLREVMAYSICGQYVPVSKANFIRVFINDQYLGLYTNVENTDSDFLDRSFGSNDGVYFQCDRVEKQVTVPSSCPPGGTGSALKSVSQDSNCYKNFYELQSDYGWSELYQFITQLAASPVDIENRLNVDRTLWMLALNNVFANFDSYSGSGHNYLIYQDEYKKFQTIMWDLNEFYGAFSNGGTGNLSISQMINLSPLFHINNPDRPLISKLLSIPSFKKRYLAHFCTIMNDIDANNAYLNLGTNLQQLIDSSVNADVNKFFTYQAFKSNLTADFTNNSPMGGKTYPGLVSFTKSRNNFLRTSSELSAKAPSIENVNYSPSTVYFKSTINITAHVSSATIVKLYYRTENFAPFESVSMFDDGQHNDGAAGDGVFGVGIIAGTEPTIQYYIYAENSDIAKTMPSRAEFEFLTIQVQSQQISRGELILNELMATNTNYIQDESGEYEDWIEIYNASNRDLPLLGVQLSDKNELSSFWSFPDTTIKSGQYLVIWADENGKSNGLHSNFKLSKNGESVFLKVNDVFLDTIAFFAQQENESYGRCGSSWIKQSSPSFGTKNNCGVNTQNENNVPNLILYPNPVSESIYLKSSSGLKISALSLVSIEGCLFLQQACNQTELSLDVSSLNSGAYVLKAKLENDQIKVFKLIKI
ncbi:MAG TPA: CotH kinase family protein [Saprospiraceae bacterium]|nr:CotH kinase family protein [Saprospiraceae bacterium]